MIAAMTMSDADVLVTALLAVAIAGVVIILSRRYFRAQEERRYRDRRREPWNDQQ